jgi:hypothetical protein
MEFGTRAILKELGKSDWGGSKSISVEAALSYTSFLPPLFV